LAKPCLACYSLPFSPNILFIVSCTGIDEYVLSFGLPLTDSFPASTVVYTFAKHRSNIVHHLAQKL
jgi:hypothetical protein